MFTQAVFYNFYFFLYLLAPRTAHRVVGYLEEEAVASYTQYLEEIDAARPASPQPPRQPAHPDISEQMIERLVRHFYGRVRADLVLAPIFDRVVDDWEPHLQTMMAFWSSVMLMSGRFKGQPVPKHKALSRVAPRDFEIWLNLFRLSAHAVCPDDIAELFIGRAEQIAESLKRGMFGLAAGDFNQT